MTTKSQSMASCKWAGHKPQTKEFVSVKIGECFVPNPVAHDPQVVFMKIDSGGSLEADEEYGVVVSNIGGKEFFDVGYIQKFNPNQLVTLLVVEMTAWYATE